MGDNRTISRVIKTIVFTVVCNELCEDRFPSIEVPWGVFKTLMIDCAEWAVKSGFAITNSVVASFLAEFGDIEVLTDNVASFQIFLNEGFVMSDGTSTIAKRTIS